MFHTLLVKLPERGDERPADGLLSVYLSRGVADMVLRLTHISTAFYCHFAAEVANLKAVFPSNPALDSGCKLGLSHEIPQERFGGKVKCQCSHGVLGFFCSNVPVPCVQCYVSEGQLCWWQ